MAGVRSEVVDISYDQEGTRTVLPVRSPSTYKTPFVEPPTTSTSQRIQTTGPGNLSSDGSTIAQVDPYGRTQNRIVDLSQARDSAEREATRRENNIAIADAILHTFAPAAVEYEGVKTPRGSMRAVAIGFDQIDRERCPWFDVVRQIPKTLHDTKMSRDDMSNMVQRLYQSVVVFTSEGMSVVGYENEPPTNTESIPCSRLLVERALASYTFREPAISSLAEYRVTRRPLSLIGSPEFTVALKVLAKKAKEVAMERNKSNNVQDVLNLLKD